MSQAKPTPVALLTTLLGEFCIPAIRGQATGKSPQDGSEVSEEVRRTLGLNSPGRTIAYPARDATVFLDLNSERAQVWFIHPDAQTALDQVRSALRKFVPGIVLMAAQRPIPGLGERFYLADLGNGRAIRVEISHPAGGADNFFVVRTIGFQVTDQTSFQAQLAQGKAEAKF